MEDQMQFVTKGSDLPQGEGWIIVKTLKVYHEADERSKICPGHGYPASTDEYMQVYESFDNEMDFLDKLGAHVRETHNDGTYHGFKVYPYVTSIKVESQVYPMIENPRKPLTTP